MAIILVVDDQRTNREFLVTLLRYQKHELLEASDGAEGLQVARERRPDLVITDILMPTMDGYEFVRQLRADPGIAATPVMFYTAQYHKHKAQALARSCGVEHMLTKPCEPETILSAVAQALGSKPPAQSSPPDDFDYQHIQVVTDKLLVTADRLQQSNQRLAALIDINLQLTSEHDLQRMLEKVCRAARELIGAKYGLLAVGKRGEKGISHFASAGMSPEIAAELERPALGLGVTGAAYDQRSAQRLSSVSTSPHALGLPSNHPAIAALLVAPIVSITHVYGWICLTNMIGAPEFDSEDEQLLSILAAQIGRIYENGSLLSDLKQQTRLLEAEIGERQQMQLALQESETRFRQIAENINEVFFLIDAADGRMLYISPAYENIWGVTCKSLYDDPATWANAIHPDDRPRIEVEYAQRSVTGAFDYEYRIVRPNGAIRHIHARGFAILDGSGKPLRTAGIAADVTAHKLAEEKIKRLNRVYAVLSGINTLIVRVRDRDELFREACRIAVEHGNFGVAWIGMFDAVTLDVAAIAWAGIDAEHIAKSLSSVGAGRPHEEGVTGRAIKRRKPVFNNNIAAEPGRGSVRRQEVIRRGYRSAIALPLLMDGAAIGALTLYAKERDFFNEEELLLLTELAGDISFALENLARRQKIDKLSRVRAVSSEINAAIVRVAEREVLLKEVCRIVSEHGKFEMIWIGAIDHDQQQVRPVAWTGFTQRTAHAVTWANIATSKGTIGEAIRTRKTAVRNDIEAELSGGALREEALKQGCRSSVCLPLVTDDKVTAVVILCTTGRAFFDNDELALLEGIASDISFALQAIAKSEQLSYLSYYDRITGLANGTLFLERVAQYLRSAATGGHKLALYLVDLERFKNINDSLGRPAGDALLKQVAAWLTRAVGDSGLLARVGADHFAVVMPQIRQEGGVARLLEKQMAAFLEYPFRLNDAVFRIAAKVGVAIYPDDGSDTDTLFRNAEAALKKAKASGERYLFYTQKMTETVAGKLTLENQLRQALDNEEFVLHYQPKVNLATGKMTSAEALIRWNDPRTGLVPPGQFIPVLEETGLIYEVGRWALRKSVEEYLRWRAAGLAAVRIAVNVSPRQLRNRGFVAEIEQAIGIDAQAAAGLELEITESLIMEDVKHNIASLQAIRALGVTIAIDDFGTGFSSLSYLSQLPVDALKIDRSFVIDMTTGPGGLALVSTIINLAHSLQLKVVAEGVEAEEQSRLLRLLRCDEMQGFLFSKPVPGEIFEAKFLAGDELMESR